MHHMGAEPCVHYGMQRAPYGSCVQAVEAMFSGLHHIGATTWSRYDICEEDGIIFGQIATYGGHMKAVCVEWELCVPYWR
jgi:hypothetical protein